MEFEIFEDRRDIYRGKAEIFSDTRLTLYDITVTTMFYDVRMNETDPEPTIIRRVNS